VTLPSYTRRRNLDGAGPSTLSSLREKVSFVSAVTRRGRHLGDRRRRCGLPSVGRVAFSANGNRCVRAATERTGRGPSSPRNEMATLSKSIDLLVIAAGVPLYCPPRFAFNLSFTLRLLRHSAFYLPLTVTQRSALLMSFFADIAHCRFTRR